ncbi:PadR family transcriptional regulator [Morganella psychrotolerans]|uniref:PadR family transcriptional regulator n=1 Tax=Morganella psychrotolerans TaxID=368603 RepID=A0A1B8HP42_9GAMM|nr:PadR family transcriptional regulator [Morganella psychrotolerans]OBU11249.1 PadR family transcriptional regulator [Morganella psychrotolerans]
MFLHALRHRTCDAQEGRQRHGGHGSHHDEHHGQSKRCCHGDHHEHGEHHGRGEHGCHGDHHEHGEHHGRGEHGCHGDHHEHGEHHGRGEHGQRRGGRGKGLRRLLDHGDLRIMMLANLNQKPSHGYELIKSISQLTSGLYTPSPGVIYPTLTLLEDQLLIVAEDTGNGRKSYSLTPEGKLHLDENAGVLEQIALRLKETDSFRRGSLLSDEIEQALGNLRALLRHKLVTSELDAGKLSKIADILNDAVQKIEAVNDALSKEGE